MMLIDTIKNLEKTSENMVNPVFSVKPNTAKPQKNGHSNSRDETNSQISATQSLEPPNENECPAQIRLVDLASQTGLSCQYIINLIEKYQIISPPHDGRYGSRKTYRFRPEDIKKVERVAHLRELDYNIKEITEMVGKENEYSKVGQKVGQALIDYYTSPEDKKWQAVIRAISESPYLDPKEGSILLMREMGCPMEECVSELGFESEFEARKVLSAAREKLGFCIFKLLKSGVPQLAQTVP